MPVKEYEVYFFFDDSVYALFSLCSILLWTQFGFKRVKNTIVTRICVVWNVETMRVIFHLKMHLAFLWNWIVCK